VFGKWGAAAANDEYLVYCPNNNELDTIIVNSALGFASVGITNANGFVTNAWMFFVFRYNHALTGVIDFQIQNNGTISSNAGIGNLNTSASSVDMATDSTHGNFGQIDLAGLGVWKRLLTAGEQATLFNSGHALTFAELPVGLLTNLNFWCDFVNNFNDASGNGNNFTQNNNPTFVAGP